MSLAQDLQATGRGVNGSAFLVTGMQSATDPMFIDDRAYVSSMNTVNRGGLVQSRPGYFCLFTLPKGNLQGGCFFRPFQSQPFLVFAVDGIVYASPYPFIRYSRIPNIQFYKSAKRLYWSVGVQTATNNADGTISLIDPIRQLLIQDGGYTRGAVWDGASARHTDPTKNEMPPGGPMVWSGNRNWLAVKNRLIPSDISNPTSFVEESILAQATKFFTEEDIIGLAEIPGLATPQLLAFTENRGFLFQSGLQDRTTWSTQINPPFQSVLFPNVGCVSHNSIVSQYGLLWWMTYTGLTNFNAAQQAGVTSALTAQDVEMGISKGNLSPNIDAIAGGAFENYMMQSVPSGDIKNRHTWVMDKTVIDNIQQATLPAWNSFWTGTNPKQWFSGPCNSVLRVFHVSTDADGENRLWESFSADRLDNGQPITSYLETKTHIDFNPKATGLDLKQIVRAEVTMTEMYGDVSVAIYWAGTRGRYKKLAEYNFSATEGSLQEDEEVSMTDIITGFRPQTRIIRTPSINIAALANSDCSVCGIEAKNLLDSIDVGFSLLIVWSGRAGVRSYRIWADPRQEKGEGDITPDETTKENTNGVVDDLCQSSFAG